MGRSHWTFDSAARTLLNRLGAGETLTGVCCRRNLPRRRTVLRWLERGRRNPDNQYGVFAKAYDLAREQGAEALLDRIQAIADGVEDPASLAIAKLKIDALKLRMVRLASRSGEARQPSAQPEPISHLEALAELE